MSWKAEIEEIHYRRRLAEQCGGANEVARHHADGTLTIRERINAVLDPGSRWSRWQRDLDHTPRTCDLSGFGTGRLRAVDRCEDALADIIPRSQRQPYNIRKLIEAETRRVTSLFLTAETFGVEDIIDPCETRPYLCAFLEAAGVGMKKTRLGPKCRAGVRP